ncbi:hypothetical protein SERLA73DRAFT_191445 [Serpula lacrymans var. lacrymans S7.3]|uniref:Uncharacterized protein n=1 Tax=Serpula lacrymans var. lacrymans (strain S7.3) TaxID=936435 RepID=F8QHM0_SERL3|nr:hypothetical protein SERLA73DRAFT_191445 [Serpula lacrymans var. lacrymans S7.3]
MTLLIFSCHPFWLANSSFQKDHRISVRTCLLDLYRFGDHDPCTLEMTDSGGPSLSWAHCRASKGSHAHELSKLDGQNGYKIDYCVQSMRHEE